jgi:murein L,D-transpeptidase YafK
MRVHLARSVVLLCVLAAPAAAQERTAANPCAGRGTAIHIDTRAHQLRLCKADRAVAQHAVSIGKKGTPKRRLGDNKTPTGTYRLGKPRPSRTYKIFLPVGYPTAKQKRQGYTGKLIGIHGPKRVFAWARRFNTLLDWTQGCIAVGSNEEIETIVDWVREEKPTYVHIE